MTQTLHHDPDLIHNFPAHEVASAKWTLSNEYTTSQLYSDSYAQLNALGYAPVWRACAFHNLLADESNLTMGEFNFQFYTPSEPTYRYTFHWIVRTYATDFEGSTCAWWPKSFSDNEQTYSLDGTGGWIGTPLMHVGVPADGTYKRIVASWVCAKPRNSSPGDSSGGGGGGGGGAGSPGIGWPGDPNCTPCCGGGANNVGNYGSGSASLDGVALDLKLGISEFARIAGILSIRESAPGPGIVSKAAIRYSGEASDTELLTAVDGSLDQVKTKQTVVNITIPTPNNLRVDFYQASLVGLKTGTPPRYTFTGLTPVVTWTVVAPNGATGNYNTIQVNEIRGASTLTTQYDWSSVTKSWTLTRPGALMKERQSIEILSDINDPFVEYKRVHEVLNPSNGSVLEYHSKTYREASGEDTRLIAEQDGTGVDARIKLYSYKTTGELEYTIDHTGRWQHYTYDSAFIDNPPPRVSNQSFVRLYEIREGIKNVAWDSNAPPDDSSLKVTRYEYDCVDCLHAPDDGTSRPWLPRREGIFFLGSQISRLERQVTTGQIVEERFASALGAWDAPENLKRVTEYETSGTSTGRIKNMSVDDGTRSLYTYAVAGSQLTVTIESGWPAANTNQFAKGTRTITITADDGRLLSAESIDIASGLRTDYKVYGNFDALGRPQLVTSGAGIPGVSTTTESYQYDCCGVSSVVARDGALTTYVYDNMKRLTETTSGGVTSIEAYGPNGKIGSRQRRGSDNSIITLSTYVYNDAGEMVQETDAAGAITKYSESVDSTPLSSGQLPYYLRKTTRAFAQPEESTSVQRDFPDGRSFENFVEYPGSLPANSDDFGNPSRRDYGIEGGEYYEKTIRMSTSGGTAEWSKVFVDFLGRKYKTRHADSTSGTESDNPTSQSYFNNAGERVRQVDPDTINTLYARLNFNENWVTLDVNKNGVVDINGNDRITKSVADVVAAYGTTVRRVRTYIYPIGSGAPDGDGWLNCVETRVDGLKSWSRQRNYTPSYLELLSTDTTVLNGSGQITRTTVAPDNSSNIEVSQYGRTTSVTRKDSGAVQLAQTTYTYDPHGRLWKTTDARNGTSTLGYDGADRQVTITSPAPGNGQSAQVTTTGYDVLGRILSVTEPDGLVRYTRYYRSGQVKLSWGARTYPVGYTYDSQGRMQTMLTWQTFVAPGLNVTEPSFPSGSTVTTWNYESWSGRLQAKRYADNKGPDYTYTAGGRLKTRRWWRTASISNPATDQTTSRITTTYKYGFDDGVTGNDHGDLVETGYANDPQNTGALTYSYDRRGNQTQVTQVVSGVPSSITVTVNRTFNDLGQMRTEQQVGGDLDGVVVTIGYDSLQRRNALSANNSSPALNYAFGYDNASRLISVTDNMTAGTPYSVTYGRLGNSELINSLTFKENTATRLTTTKSYDYLNRLAKINNQPGASADAPLSYAYEYNAANQRTRMILQDNSYWAYDYDSLGQLTKGIHVWPDSTQIPGQQFEYAYDAIGNRTGSSGARSGGDSSGANLRSTGYTPNNLNQYVSRANHRYLEIQGGANATVANITVAITGGSPVSVGYRRGEYFRHEWSVVGTSPSWQNASINVTGGTAQAGNLYLPPATETFGYDGDGNMTSDGRWTYKWDAENRIVQVTTTTAAFAAGIPGRKVEYNYDHQGRIRRQVTYTGNPSTDTWTVDSGSETRMVYDGWQCIADLNSAKVLQRAYMWGLDLSGSTIGAGGVGGLLTVRSVANGVHFVGYDGNGNVVVLAKGSDGTIGARYEYDAFGNAIRKTGAAIAQENPWEFSTKRKDRLTGACIYEYRQYRTEIGRWINRDPIEEEGGLLLYGFVDNDPINGIDLLGLRGTGHHIVPEATMMNICGKLGNEFWKKFLDEAVGATIPVPDKSHDNTGHGTYNKKVEQLIRDYMKSKNISCKCLKGKHATKMLKTIVNSSDPYIRGFLRVVGGGSANVAAWKIQEGNSILEAEKMALKRLGKPNGILRYARWGGKIIKVVSVGAMIYQIKADGLVAAMDRAGRDLVFADEALAGGEWLYDETYTFLLPLGHKAFCDRCGMGSEIDDDEEDD